MPGPIPPFKRLLDGYELDKETGCWLWTGAMTATGYGEIKVFGRFVGAHRFSYELHKGPVPNGMEILHSCDVKACINPDHLRAGSHAENMAEARERGLIRSGDRHPQFGRKKPQGIKNRLSKPVRVLGKLYSSQKEAEAALGLGSGTVRYWVRKNQGKAELISRQEYESNA